MMATKTGISWCDVTLNAATGCTEVSAGCDHCYAHLLALRLQAMGQAKYANGFEYTEHIHVLGEVAGWRTPRRVFVNSMSDFWHEEATWLFVSAALDTFWAAPQHTFQILTKRPGKMRSWVEHYCDSRELDALPAHIWLGVSTEDQATADLRIPMLLATRCRTRFVSAEPLLGPIDLSAWLGPAADVPPGWRGDPKNAPSYQPGLDWVIAGGESGPNYRPMDLDWARSLRDQCLAARVPFFFKQSAARMPGQGALLDGVEWHQFPETAAMTPAVMA